MKRNTICKCKENGIVFEILSKESEICKGPGMEVLEAKTADSATEKHVPVLTEIENGVKVTVGSTLHPMTEEHSIEWIEVINGDYVNRKYLNPGDEPVAEFYVKSQKDLVVREYCNVHGLWESK